jgi:hypothetical protein
MYKEEQKFLDKLKESFEAYKKIKQGEPSFLDYQLLNMVDKDLIKLFNETLQCNF